MATLDILKRALVAQAQTFDQLGKRILSDQEYNDGFDVFLQSARGTTYEQFIIPQLDQLFNSISTANDRMTVLEIGPGKSSVLEYLSKYLRLKIKRYVAFEPNTIYADTLRERLCENFPKASISIIKGLFDLDETKNDEKFDIVLFCHSLYGLNPKHKFIERALGMLEKNWSSGLVVVFHRNNLEIQGLVAHQVASYFTTISIPDNGDHSNDVILDKFASFIAGFSTKRLENGGKIQSGWRRICRDMGVRKGERLCFSSPSIMMVFKHSANSLQDLRDTVPVAKFDRVIKNPEASSYRPASIFRPTQMQEIQKCVRWAVEHNLGLTVIGGSHSGHCIQPNVVAIDLSAFNAINFTKLSGGGATVVVAEAGCKSGDIIAQAQARGLTVPLGSRPGVGAGLWLLGGIGHLARLHGLTCDSILGAVLISVNSGQIVCVGSVPEQYQPPGAVRPGNEAEILWALKGAGTNFGILVSATLQVFSAPNFNITNWIIPMKSTVELKDRLIDYDTLLASRLDPHCSADAYLYSEGDQVHLGIAVYEISHPNTKKPDCTDDPETSKLCTEHSSLKQISRFLAQMPSPTSIQKGVDMTGLFEKEMYISSMHGGYGHGKTSSFKRCVFLNKIGDSEISEGLILALECRPSNMCYFHLIQGGQAVKNVAADATAFGCRDWDFACIITGVWPRAEDSTKVAENSIRWVYGVVHDLKPWTTSVYGADLGPDPRDRALSLRAFGQNRPRLLQLKSIMDPHGVLSYASPLLAPPKLIILITGRSGAGKDYCAKIWESILSKDAGNPMAIHTASISDDTKKQYALNNQADYERLLSDRAYKEQHREGLSQFYQQQCQDNPHLKEQNFLNIVYQAIDKDVFLITGMRDKSVIAKFSPLVPFSRLISVYVHADERTLHGRRYGTYSQSSGATSAPTFFQYQPSFIFLNGNEGDEAPRKFANERLLPLIDQNLKKLSSMVRTTPNFPRPGISFRHVLGIVEQPRGLTLCTSLFEEHFAKDWQDVGAIVACEAGGYLFALVLATQVKLPLVLVRGEGKIPPPTVCAERIPSHISGSPPKLSRRQNL